MPGEYKSLIGYPTDLGKGEEVAAMNLPEDVANQNQNSLKTLLRAITRSEGAFSLILARCNQSALREQIVQQLQEQCTVQIRELVLEQSVKTLYTTIEAKLGQEQPTALMVFGLERVSALEQVLTSTNRVREEFRNFAFPLVLWVTDEVLQKLIRLAPDFYSWATTVEFAIATDQLLQFIQQTTDRVFAKVLDAGASLFLDNTALNLGVGSPRRAELESARKELQNRGVNLDPELEASLEFVLGRDATGSLEQSQQHYQRSLAFWQQSDNLERRGCLLFFLGLWWRTYLLGHRNEYERACRKARYYFERSIEAFEQANRLDLVAKFINPLGDSLQRLKDWDELEIVANKALSLHQSNLELFRLARAYGFLADVALSKSDWTKALSHAQFALDLLANAEAEIPTPVSAEECARLDWERSFHKGWYLFSLAKAYLPLGLIKEALKTLEVAKATTKSQYDPELYIQILEQLRKLYFKQGDYQKAFQTKQERRLSEHQYGYRAFIGASRLQPKQKVTNPALPYIQQQGTVAQEFAASGREEAVNRLVDRLSRDDCRLTVIHGQSGVGKSSLVQAGLIPALKQKMIGTRDVLPVLQQVYTDWTRNLAECLAEAFVETQNCTSFYGTATGLSSPVAPTLTCSFANMPEPVALDSTTAILEQLQKNAENNLLTVLIFDQFEEFFFSYKDALKRRFFYEFLLDCLNIPYVKVILSLREDYIAYLLECNDRLTSLDVVNNNILNKSNLFYLGNFSTEETKLVIHNFTEKANFYLEKALIDELVNDLAGELGEVRPIELQVVGSQLQAENIRTLAKYRQYGPKTELVKQFLDEVIKDCGPENEQAARLVLYLLTDDSGTRPFKNRTELVSALSELEESEKLDLVLDILVKSGLVFLLPEGSAERYQLVHDYLVAFIRQQHNLLAKLEEQRQELLRKRAEIQRLGKLKGFLGTAVVVGILMGGLATWAELQRQRAVNSENLARSQRQRAVNSEIRAHADSSESLFASNKQLDALQESLIAGMQLKREGLAQTNSSTQAKVVTALQRIVYSNRERNRLEGHTDTVFSVRFSPDGQTLASASADKTVKLWSLNGKLLRTLKGHRDTVFSVSFSPDGQTIASASKDRTVKLWSLDGRLLRNFKGHTRGVLSVTFSPDGQTIASASHDGTVKLWRPDGSVRTTIKGHDKTVLDVNFSPNGQIIASASLDGTVKLWRLDGQPIRSLKAHTDGVQSVSFSPNGKTLFSAGVDGNVKIWNLDGTLLKTFKGDKDAVLSVSFSRDGQKIVSASQDGTVKLWNLEGELQETLKGHQYRVYSASFSPDGKTVASAGSEHTIRLWNVNSKGFKTLRGHEYRLSTVSFSSNGQMLASASEDKIVKLWKPDGTFLRNLPGHQAEVWAVSFSPDSKMLASASADKTVKLWSLEGKVLKTLRGHANNVSSVNFHPNGQTIASASKDNTIKLWTRDGKLLRDITGHTGAVNWVSFSPNGKMMASASDDETVKLWKSDGTLLKTLKGHSYWVLGVSFSPDSQTIASASADGTVKLWNLDGKLLKTLDKTHDGHNDWVYKVNFSPDGQTFASTSRDGTIKLWKRDGTLLITLKRHEYGVKWVSFSPDGHTLVSGGDDKTVILWDLDKLNLDNLLSNGCNQARNYLKTNPNVSESDRTLCDGIGTQK